MVSLCSTYVCNAVHIADCCDVWCSVFVASVFVLISLTYNVITVDICQQYSAVRYIINIIDTKVGIVILDGDHRYGL